MIGKDAINILKGIQQENLEENDFLGKCAIDMAIEALHENESLAKTVIEASELLRKQRPHGTWKVRHDTMYHFECPFCKYLHQYKDNFCPLCGADMREGDGE